MSAHSLNAQLEAPHLMVPTADTGLVITCILITMARSDLLFDATVMERGRRADLADQKAMKAGLETGGRRARSAEIAN
jgi:hypothetical protein